MEFMNVERKRKMKVAKRKAAYKREMAREKAIRRRKFAKKYDWEVILFGLISTLGVIAIYYYAWFIY